MSQLDPVHILSSHFLRIHLNIILSSTARYPKWSLSFRFPHQKPVYASPLLHTRYMIRPSLLNPITSTLFGEVYRSLTSSLCSFLQSPLTSPLLGPNTHFYKLYLWNIFKNYTRGKYINCKTTSSYLNFNFYFLFKYYNVCLNNDLLSSIHVAL